MKIKFLQLLASFLIYSNLFGQTTEWNKLDEKIIEGYFVLLRDSIWDPSSDAVPPRMSFKIFYLKTLNENVVSCLQKLNRPSSDSLVFLSKENNAVFKYDSEQKQYDKYISDSAYLKKIENKFPFQLNYIPDSLINGDSRFVAIFNGKLTVVGPFKAWVYPYHRLNLPSQLVYMYLPLKSDKLKYLYSIQL